MNIYLYSVVGYGEIFHAIIIQNPTPKVNLYYLEFWKAQRNKKKGDQLFGITSGWSLLIKTKIGSDG